MTPEHMDYLAGPLMRKCADDPQARQTIEAALAELAALGERLRGVERVDASVLMWPHGFPLPAMGRSE